MYKPGTYSAHVVDHDLQVTDENTLKAVNVQFEFLEEGKELPSKITWYGSMKGGAVPISLRTLVLLGYKGKNDEDFLKLSRWNGEGMPLSPMVLDEGKAVDIVIEHETYNGKTSARVKYVNDPGRSALKRSGGVKPTLAGLNLSAELAEIRSKAPAAKDDGGEHVPF